MNMPDPRVQRQLEEEEKKKEEEEEEYIQPKAENSQIREITPDLESRINSIRGGGQPLRESDRSFMERRFGIDFSGIRVHTDSNAVQMSRELNAQAFTVGRDIYFGAGKYSPSTSSGKRLLAHELTHVVQQSLNRFPVKQTMRAIFVRDHSNYYGKNVDVNVRRLSKSNALHTINTLIKLSNVQIQRSNHAPGPSLGLVPGNPPLFVCVPAVSAVRSLRENLELFNNEFSRLIPDPGNLTILTQLVKLSVERIILYIKDYRDQGCDLRDLESTVMGLVWPQHRIIQQYRGALHRAVREASYP